MKKNEKKNKSPHCCDNHALCSIAQIWPPDCEQLSAVYHPHKITKPFTVEIQHCTVLSTYTSVQSSPLFLPNAPMKNYFMHSTCETEVPPFVW